MCVHFLSQPRGRLSSASQFGLTPFRKWILPPSLYLLIWLTLLLGHSLFQAQNIFLQIIPTHACIHTKLPMILCNTVPWGALFIYSGWQTWRRVDPIRPWHEVHFFLFMPAQPSPSQDLFYHWSSSYHAMWCLKGKKSHPTYASPWRVQLKCD